MIPPSCEDGRPNRPQGLPLGERATPAPSEPNGDSLVSNALKPLMDELPDGILLIDEDWRILYANRTARRISHIQPENLNRETLWELYPEIVGTRLERAYREVVATGTEATVDAFYYEPFQTWFDVCILPRDRGVALHYRNVTAVREANTAREAIAERLHHVLEATTDAVVSVDRDWRITYLNQHAMKIVAPSGDVLGTNLWESFPRAIYENSPYTEHYYRAMDEGLPGEFEAAYPDPLNIWVQIQVRPARDGIVLFFRDITERRREAAALRESEARMNAIYSTSLGYIGLLAPDGTILDCNRASLQFANNTREEVVGLRFWDSPWFKYTPGAPELLQQAIARAAEGEFVRYEAPLIRPSGETITFDFSISPVRNAVGEVIFLVPEGHDITNLLRAEAALGQTTQALMSSEEELRWTVDLNPQTAWTADAAGHLLDFSHRWLELTGLTREQVIGEEWMQATHSEDLAHMAESWRQALQSGHSYDVEHRVRTATGEYRWMRSRAYPRRDGVGRIVKWYGTTDDIDERKRAEESLIQSEKLAAVGRLATSIAHEINNPLESVTNLLYLARNSNELSQVQEYLDTAERELRRVSVISNQTLRFHKQSTKPTAVFCQELIDGGLSVYQGRIVNSHVMVEKRKRALKPVTCFDGEIRQVLNNLVGNAIDAMHPAGGRLLIRSREATNGKTGQKGLVLTVADTGVGMSPSVQKRIFEPFFTTKGIGGTGLGLWVSQEIVARHRGTLRVRSSQRKTCSGTVFTLFLPFDSVSR